MSHREGHILHYVSVCQHRRCKNSSVEICPVRSASRIERVGWIHLLLLTDCNSQDLDITADSAEVAMLNPGLRCAFRWNYPWTKIQETPEGNLEKSSIWRSWSEHNSWVSMIWRAQIHIWTTRWDVNWHLELNVPRITHLHSSLCLATRQEIISGTPLILRCIDKVQNVTQKII